VHDLADEFSASALTRNLRRDLLSVFIAVSVLIP